MMFDCRYALKKNRDDWLDKATDNVAPLNNVVSSLFKSVKLQLNNVTINRDDDHYHLKAYLHDLYTYDVEHKETLLKPGGWYSDTNNHFNDMDVPNEAFAMNQGFHERKLFFMTTQGDYMHFHAHFVAKILTDFEGSVNGLLIPGVDIRLDFTLNDPKVYLMSNTATGTTK